MYERSVVQFMLPVLPEAQEDIEKQLLVALAREELQSFPDESGIYAGKDKQWICAENDNVSQESGCWHRVHSFGTEVLQPYSCRAVSKIVGIGSSE